MPDRNPNRPHKTLTLALSLCLSVWTLACGDDGSETSGSEAVFGPPLGGQGTNNGVGDGDSGMLPGPGPQLPGDGDSAGIGDGDTAGIGDGDTAGTGDGDTAGIGDGDTAGTGDGDTAGTGDGDTAGTGDGDTAGTGDGDTAGTGDGDDSAADLEPFSFFVTSLAIMQELSGSSDGFGGDLGGLEGADSICQQAADKVGFGAKTWRAFLSATDDGSGNPVHAIDRIGQGPWYDRNGRLIAEDIAGLLAGDRPAGDTQAVNDLPNEFGEGLQAMGDTHDIITGTNTQGQLDSTDPANTCNDWTSTTVTPAGGGSRPRGGSGGGVRLGHSWPARSGMNWMTVHTARSCAAGVNLIQNGGGDGSSIGAGGGWGAIYCFALTP